MLTVLLVQHIAHFLVLYKSQQHSYLAVLELLSVIQAILYVYSMYVLVLMYVLVYAETHLNAHLQHLLTILQRLLLYNMRCNE